MRCGARPAGCTRGTRSDRRAASPSSGASCSSGDRPRDAGAGRYDGQRPLAPWLIRVFQNLHLSKLRQHGGAGSLPDDDIAVPLPTAARVDRRWHEAFVAAARDWLDSATESERLILGLRWRYRMSQREVAHLLGVHEGTISRQTDKLRTTPWRRSAGGWRPTAGPGTTWPGWCGRRWVGCWWTTAAGGRPARATVGRPGQGAAGGVFVGRVGAAKPA